MLMEYSGSAYNYFAYKAASWGSNFLNHLDPLDWVAPVTYDIKPIVQQDFTSNKAQLQQTLSTLSYPQFREANMYDAIIDTLDRLDRVKGRKAVLLISTGANTMSASTLDDTLKRVKPKRCDSVLCGRFGKGASACRWNHRLSSSKKPAPDVREATDYVLLVMNPRGADSILTSKVKLGAGVSAAAGPKGRDAIAATDAALRAEVLSYSRSRGLFAGAFLDGSTLRPDNDANKKLYNRDFSAKEIVLEGKVAATSAAELLLSVLNKRSPKNLSRWWPASLVDGKIACYRPI